MFVEHSEDRKACANFWRCQKSLCQLLEMQVNSLIHGTSSKLPRTGNCSKIIIIIPFFTATVNSFSGDRSMANETKFIVTANLYLYFFADIMVTMYFVCIARGIDSHKIPIVKIKTTSIFIMSDLESSAWLHFFLCTCASKLSAWITSPTIATTA